MKTMRKGNFVKKLFAVLAAISLLMISIVPAFAETEAAETTVAMSAMGGRRNGPQNGQPDSRMPGNHNGRQPGQLPGNDNGQQPGQLPGNDNSQQPAQPADGDADATTGATPDGTQQPPQKPGKPDAQTQPGNAQDGKNPIESLLNDLVQNGVITQETADAILAYLQQHAPAAPEAPAAPAAPTADAGETDSTDTGTVSPAA